MSQYNYGLGGHVLAAEATANGQMVGSAAVLRGLHFNDASGGSPGSVVLKNGGSGGTEKVKINTPGKGNGDDVVIPGAGVVFDTDIYVELTNVDGVTIFYQ